MSFKSLGLSSELLQIVTEKGYGKPTPIQLQAIPMILNGIDIMASAQTGTGKTAGFTLPILQLLTSTTPANPARRIIRALILTPTRELAVQVSDSVRTYSKYLNLRSEVVFGGVNIIAQIHKMRRGTDILVATPGRLLDLINQNVISLDKVEILVLDEADRMLDMGFSYDVKRIVSLLPKKRQSMLFSATLSSAIQNVADSILKDPKIIKIASNNGATGAITQVIHPVDRKRKRELLSFMIGSKNWQQVLVFTRTKHGASRLCEQLISDGLTATAIHGDKSQGARMRALAEFKTGKTRILVATDVASRGIDIVQLPYVVNFDLPDAPEDYIHRIGRTGRAGNKGMAVSLVCVDEHHLLRDIEKTLKEPIPKEVIMGYEPDHSIKSEKTSSTQRRYQHTSKRQGTNKQENTAGRHRYVPKSDVNRSNSTNKHENASGRHRYVPKKDANGSNDTDKKEYIGGGRHRYAPKSGVNRSNSTNKHENASGRHRYVPKKDANGSNDTDKKKYIGGGRHRYAPKRDANAEIPGE